MGCDSNKQKSPNKQDALKIKETEKQTKKTIEAKIVLLGEQNVGKSSIAQRYCKNSFSEQI